MARFSAGMVYVCLIVRKAMVEADSMSWLRIKQADNLTWRACVGITRETDSQNPCRGYGRECHDCHGSMHDPRFDRGGRRLAGRRHG